MTEPYRICLFTGGRGTSSIVKSLVKVQNVQLTLLLNAYDDGLSTGALRELFPGMLGPSDIRKAFSTLFEASDDKSDQLLAKLFEYRISGLDYLGRRWDPHFHTFNDSHLFGYYDFLQPYFSQLPQKIGNSLENWLDSSLESIQRKLGIEDSIKFLKDCALGNLFFTGAYLQASGNFNAAINEWGKLFSPRAQVLNVTNGENRRLVGMKENGAFLPDEASIVNRHLSEGRIKKLYLLKDNPKVLQEIFEVTTNPLILEQTLEKHQDLPTMSTLAKKAIKEADMIVYGPGTQHSSLLPSYMTVELSNSIAENRLAEKVFISNIARDHDIREENHDDLLRNVHRYMNFGNSSNRELVIEDIVSVCLLSSSSEIEVGAVNSFPGKLMFFSLGNDKEKHDGMKVSQILLTIASSKEKFFSYEHSLARLTIIMPILNEIKKLREVLEDLLSFDWIKERIVPEIILVDGGSTDGSWELAQTFPAVVTIQDSTMRGRGSAVRLGLKLAKGDFVVTFPGDAEYEVEALVDVVRALASTAAPLVFGSRTTLCVDTDSRLQEIYSGKTREYYFSKYGGMILSLISALRFRRWISDPLTSIKGFRRGSLNMFTHSGDSLDWDTRLIVESWRHGIPIVEIPVNFYPRTRHDGKKTNFASGLKALKELIRFRLSR